MSSIIKPKDIGASLLELLPGSLPTTRIPSDTDLEAVVDKLLRDFPKFQGDQFADDALWREHFQGILFHSSDYSSAQNWAGKSGIVVGTANTVHDVADDMQKAGMQVTMVQRSRTFVLPVEFIKDRYDIIYNEEIPTEISDRSMFSNPVSIARLLSAKTFHAMARAQPERYEALERAGFKVDPFGDIQEAINIRLGGHYIDVGTSAKIGKGLIKVKSDAPATRYTEHGLEFSDGVEVKADVIVLAIGFVGNLRHHVEKSLAPESQKELETASA